MLLLRLLTDTLITGSIVLTVYIFLLYRLKPYDNSSVEGDRCAFINIIQILND